MPTEQKAQEFLLNCLSINHAPSNHVQKTGFSTKCSIAGPDTEFSVFYKDINEKLPDFSSMHWGVRTVNIGNGFMAFCMFRPYLNGEHCLMCLGFYIGKDWLLKQLIDFWGGSAFWAVLRLPMALLKIWLFSNSHLLITANESRRNSFQECWLALSEWESCKSHCTELLLLTLLKVQFPSFPSLCW